MIKAKSGSRWPLCGQGAPQWNGSGRIGGGYRGIDDVLSDRIGKRLGIHPTSHLPKIGMTTAGGKLEAPLFILDSLKIGDAEVFNVEASTNPHMGKMDGLLGMTFLGEFKVEMDRENSELILKPLGSPEDELWDGKNKTWWKKKYETYTGTIRQLQRAVSQAGSDVHKIDGNQKTDRPLRKTP